MTDKGIFRVMLRMEIRSGQAEAFEEAWYAGAWGAAGNPANLGQWLCRTDDEPDIFYVISDWTDEARFREYERSAQHRAHRANLDPFRVRVSMWCGQEFAATGLSIG